MKYSHVPPKFSQVRNVEEIISQQTSKHMVRNCKSYFFFFCRVRHVEENVVYQASKYTVRNVGKILNIIPPQFCRVRNFAENILTKH